MQKNWLIIADSAEARILENTPPGYHLQQVHSLDHPESRMYAHQLRTGGKGEVMDSAGSGQRQSDPQTSQMEKHAERFAKELADFLRQQRDKEAFSHLILIAEPKVLGRLRGQLDSRTLQLVSHSIDKNWTQHGTRQIEQLLQQYN